MNTPNTSPTLRVFSRCLFVLAIFFQWGCQRKEEIRVYRISSADRVQRVDAQGTPDTQGPPTKMIAAIVPNPGGDASWFFKLTGDPTVIDENTSDFRGIVESLQFDAAGKPAWQLADGWTDEELQGITYAKLFKKEDDLTATVTRLENRSAADPAAWHQWITENVNRWRGQLALPPEDWDGLSETLEPLDQLSDDGIKAYYVSIEGTGSGSMGGAPFAPFAGGASSPAAGQSERPEQPETAADPVAPPSEFEYDLPESWSLSTKANAFRKATFNIEDAPETQVIISEATGSDEDIVKIWLGQVQLEENEQLVKETIEAAVSRGVNEVDSRVFSVKSDMAITVAAIPWKETSTLFVKLIGPAETVAKQQENLGLFLDSLRWPAVEAE